MWYCLRTLHYRELAPPAALAATIQCLWTMEGDARELGSDLQPVLPDGRPELILHLGDPFERIDESGRRERQAALLFAGQLTRQLVLRPTGRIAVAGVRFRADGAAALLEIPQNDLTGLTVPLGDLSASLGRDLSEVRSATDAPGPAMERLLGRLLPRLAGARPDPRIRSVVDVIDRSRGQVTIGRLAERVGITRRHLERRFQATVGISPKRLARIARFQHALRLLDALDLPDRGSRTATTCGYADQAHFIRDFGELAGCAPGEHLLRRCEMTGFFTCSLTDTSPD